MRVIISSSFVVILLLTLFSMANADEWDDAANAVTRLSPKIFPELPTSIADELVKKGCTIPQPDIYISLKKRTGVISGSFAKSGQKDYAVLCSRNGVSHIQVIWGGTSQCESELKPRHDRDSLQGGPGPGGIAYSRAIATASQRTIAAYQSEYHSLKFPDTSHDGIEDIFIEKGSSILYCANGKWTKHSGAD